MANNAAQNYDGLPTGWKPYTSRLPASTAARLDLTVHPVSNPTAPGFAYGTMKPLNGMKMGMEYGKHPNIAPVGKSFTLQVPMQPQIAGITPNYARSINIPGAISYIPGPSVDQSSLDAIQTQLAMMRL